jgi:endo-1,4-beta-xylanase
MPTRGYRLGVLLTMVTAAVAVFAGAQAPLREAADRADVLIGTAVRPAQLSEPAYASTLAREFNMIEPEDVMKWWVVRQNAGAFNFGPADEVVRFARAHDMKIRGHCLVWGRSNPEWLAQGQFTAAQLSELLHHHIEQMMRRYAGDVFAWDVVNEALDENGKVRDSLWYNQPGIGFSGKGTLYIEQAFRWAREADPRALLFYNEAEGEGLNRKSDAIYSMVQEFKRRGVPIDGVGLQLHISSFDFNLDGLAANIARLAKLGVQVHITELDVSLRVDAHGNPLHVDDLARQAEIYRGVLRACLQTPRCTAVQTWGFTDKYSWIGSSSRGTRGAALPFHRFYQPKPAYNAILDALRDSRNPRP